MTERDFQKECFAFAQTFFDDVREMSKDVAGVSRQGYGPQEEAVHDYAKAIAKKLAMEIKTDAVGNLWLTLPGKNRSLPALVSGSHGDSVPQGGNYDGLAGVVAAITLAWWMRQIHFVPERDYTVLIFRMEESSWFGRAYVGSLGLMGQWRESDMALTHRDTGVTLAETIRRAGFNVEAGMSGKPIVDLKKIAAFIELHIEQGPSLDASEKERVAVVTGIRGNIRHKHCCCHGETAHSGAVNREFRHDAVMAMGELLHRMDTHWVKWLERGEDLVFTVGVFNTAPTAAIAIIAGEVTFSVDIRSLSMDTLRRFHALLQEECLLIGRERGVTFTFDDELICEPGTVDALLSDKIYRASQNAGIACTRVPSGAGHDAAVMSNAGIASAMIFVANQHGSHNANEAMQTKDFIVGANMLWEAVKHFDD